MTETVEPFSLGAISDYSGIIERPLFSRNRRLAGTAGGAATATIPSAANIRSGQFRLAGVIIMGDEKYALLKHEQDPEYSRVEEGTLFQNWLVEAILPGERRFFRASGLFGPAGPNFPLGQPLYRSRGEKSSQRHRAGKGPRSGRAL